MSHFKEGSIKIFVFLKDKCQLIPGLTVLEIAENHIPPTPCAMCVVHSIWPRVTLGKVWENHYHI